MGRVREQYLLFYRLWREDASYEEAQSRLRMSTLCKDCVRQRSYPLPARIVELASAQADAASQQPSQAMDRSRSPRAPLSDEARLLQRLAEPQLPPEATDAERAAARTDAAAGVEHAVDELGGHWAEAHQELRPGWQPTPTDIEISNQRAVELTAARAEITRLSAEITRLSTENTRLDAAIYAMHEELYDGIDASREIEERAGPESVGLGGRVAIRHMQSALNYQEQPSYRYRLGLCERCGLHPTCGMSVSYNGSWPPTHLCRSCYDAETTATDNQISNQRAAELTAARAETARLQAENARLREWAEQALNAELRANAAALMAALLQPEGE